MRKEKYSIEAHKTIEIIEKEYNIEWNNKNDLKYLSSLDLRFKGITDISSLKELKNLLTLNLTSNSIVDISSLKALNNLRFLDLKYNSITDISFLKKLTKLEILDLKHNKITNISSLNELKNLTTLSLSTNNIKIFPKELLDLNMEIHLNSGYGWNAISESADKGIILGSNSIQEPPLVTMSQGKKSIQRYFDDIKLQGRGKLNEAKLILVGEPEAGKSSLMECLLNPSYRLDPNNKSTMGISVKPWKFSHPYEENRTMRANIWDFGGQQIQYMTHQFFLTPDSLYVLVTANDRKEANSFPYWFKIIHLLGELDGRYSPVLVVKNKKSDKFHFDFDEVSYRKMYPNLEIEVREIDLGNRNSDFDALQEKIINLISKLPLVNADRPAKWSLIRKDLGTIDENHINFQSYAKICRNHGVDNIDSQKILSSYLHSTGTLLHFVNDSSLKDFIILRPQWAVDAVYSILSNTKVAENSGSFSQELLDNIWKDYTPSEQVNLLSLMKKDNFEICYPIDSTNFIAPQLLPNTKPHYSFDESQTLKFRFSYKFMPAGIITRLIVRLSEYIQDDLVWKKGVVLCSDNCQAQVIEEDNKDGLKIIDIHINGDILKQKYFLHIIRQEIQSIHSKWFSNIQSEEMIPCSCSECINNNTPYYFANATLKKFQQKRQETIQCQESTEDVSLLSLVEGVLLPNKSKNSKGYEYTIESYFEDSSNVGKNEKINNNTTAQEKEIPWYKEWLSISFLITLFGGLISWFTLSFSFGIVTSILIFLVMLMFNPKRRFFRVGLSILFLSSLQLIPFKLIPIPKDSFFYDYIKIIETPIPYLGIILIVLSGFLFWLDSKEK